MAAYLTHTASHLPGPPVPNDAIERYLGVLRDDRGRLRERVLRNNGIVSRHYAIDPETGRPNATLAQMFAAAARVALAESGTPLDDVDLLACACSIPDAIAPGLAAQVHGELGGRPLEIATLGGICASALAALKYATMAVRGGDSRCAVVGAAERLSAQLRASWFGAEIRARQVDESDPHVALGAEFLRWMLSDGAGCALVRPEPAPGRLSLRVEWVQLASFAHELPTCMYMGGERLPDGSLSSWRDGQDPSEAVRRGMFNLQQDVGLLRDHIVPVTTWRTLERMREERGLTGDQVDWLLPHFSSNLFREPALAEFRKAGFDVPDARVRSNLATRGNIGSASIFVMLDDLMRSGDVRPGDGVLCAVPESGRFTMGFALLRAVEA